MTTDGVILWDGQAQEVETPALTPLDVNTKARKRIAFIFMRLTSFELGCTFFSVFDFIWQSPTSCSTVGILKSCLARSTIINICDQFQGFQKLPQTLIVLTQKGIHLEEHKH